MHNDNHDPMPTVKADIKGIGTLLAFIVIMFGLYQIVLGYKWLVSLF